MTWPTIDFAILVVKEGTIKIYNQGLALARAMGLDTTSWETGDPTRSLYFYLAETLDKVEDSIITYGKASTLSTLEDNTWASVHSHDMYGIDRTGATYAEPKVTLRNDGGGEYPLAVGDLTVKASASGKTYHNSSLGYDPDTLTPAAMLLPGVTLTFDLTADEAGSDSTVGTDDIDALVTTLEGVTIVGSKAAAASDDMSLQALVDLCSLSTGQLSPMSPKDIFDSVARQQKYTGVTEITRSTTIDDSDNNYVAVYLAGSSGSVSAETVDAVLAALRKWAQGFCQTVEVFSATPS